MNTVIGAPTTATTTTNVSPHSNSTMTPLNTMNTILSMATPPPTPFRSDAGGTPAQPNGNNGIAAVVIVVNNEIGGDSISSKESSGLLGELLVAKVITNVPAHLAAMRASSSFSPLGSGAATSGLDDTTAGTSTQTATTANTRHKQSPSTLLPTEDVTATASLIVSANSPFDQSRNLNSTTNVCVAPNNSLASATMPPTSNKYANPFHPPAFYQPQQPSDRFTASVGGLNSQLQQNGGGGNNNASTRSNNASGLLASMTAINNENGSFGGGGMSVTVGTGNGSLLAQFFPASTTDRPLSASATAFTPPVPRTGLVPHVHVDPTIQNRFQYNNSTSVASVGGNNNTANNLKASVSNSSTTLGKTNNGHGNNNNKSNSPLAGTKGSNAEDSIEVYAPDSKIVYTVPKELVSHFGTEPTGGKRMICRSYSNAYASSHELPQGLSATDNSLRDGGATSPASKKSSQSNNTSINNNSSDPNLVVTNIGGGTCQMGSNCKFVHIDALLSSLKMDEVHVHYIWRDIECVTYERLNSVLVREHPTLDRSRVMNTVLRIFGPNHREPAEEVSTANLLYTKGSRYAFEIVAGIIPTAGPHPCHCAHYYFNQVCNRGAGCGFVHVISLNPKQAEAKVRHSNFHKRLEAMGAEAKYPLYSNPQDQYTAGYYRWQEGHHPAPPTPAYGSGNNFNHQNNGDQYKQPMPNHHNQPPYIASGNAHESNHYGAAQRTEVLPSQPPIAAAPSTATTGPVSVTIGTAATSLLPPSMDAPYQSRVPPPPPLGASNNGSRATSPRFLAHSNLTPQNPNTVEGISVIKEMTQNILISTPSPQWHQSPGQSANQLMLSPSSDPCSVGAEIPNDPIDNVPTPTRNFAKGNTPNAARHRQIPSSAQSPPMPPASALQNNANLSKQQSGQFAWPPQPRNSPPPLLMDSGVYLNNNQQPPNNNRANLEGYHQHHSSGGNYEDEAEEDMDAKYHRRFASEENHKIQSVKDSENGLAASGREGSFRGLGASGYNNNGLDKSLNGTANLNNTVSSSCGGGARYSYNPYSTNQVLRTHPSSLCSSAVATPATRSPAVKPIFGMSAEALATEGGMFPKMTLPQAEGQLDIAPPPPPSPSPSRSSVRV
eukprot:GDKK01005161.1.p1 GENE.GDKK01005161.1~~GDKK01005161.1.p1  ORF type:complete len:1235 (+),score=149.12 GDKK01005161.1:363-3707(+)